MASYVAFGALAGLVILGAGVGALSLFDIPSSLESEGRSGLIALAAVTAVGWPATTYYNVLHGTQRFKAAAAVDIAGHVVFATAIVAMLFVFDAPLWLLIAAGGSIPLSTGLASLLVVRAQRLPYRLRPNGLDVPGCAASSASRAPSSSRRSPTSSSTPSTGRSSPRSRTRRPSGCTRRSSARSRCCASCTGRC